jgi:hypothetical protein
MSELTMMAETIREAMRAVEEAHAATVELGETTNHETFNAFKVKMTELEEHLTKLMMVLDNEEAYAMDQLMDALSRAYSDHRADYRRTPRMQEE